jgi:hypothetical protein
MRQIVSQIVKECKWTTTSVDDHCIIVKTNPGFVNQSWGHLITFKLYSNAVLVNCIFDLSIGGRLITFGSNKKNVNSIKKKIMEKIMLISSSSGTS